MEKGIITIHMNFCDPEDAAILAKYLDREAWDWEADARARSLIRGESIFVEGEDG